MANLIPMHKLLTLNRKAALILFNTLLRLKGLYCDIYNPETNESIFGLDDSIISYPGLPNKTDEKLLIFNLFQEGYIGAGDFDPFIQETYILTKYADALPLQTKVVINFLGRQLTMKVDDQKNLFPTTQEQLFVKNTLAPIA